MPVRTGGRLLVATPDLGDPNFERTVVFMLEHSTQGALGLVLNRAMAAPVGEILPVWAPFASEPGRFHAGGPVEPDGVIALARLAPGAQHEGTRRFDSGVITLDLSTEPDDIGPSVERLRLFAGHAGWGPGQLDGELRQRGWYVFDAEAEDVFDAEPDDLWYRVCERQGGTMRWLRHYPDDPRHN